MNTPLAAAVISLPIFILATVEFASAATYYVDASLGNDQWSGLRDAPSGSPASDGPWRSLTKVSAAAFAPGDTILLRCGGKWAETLTLNSSGTASAPIRIGAYPQPYASKPAIYGSKAVPAGAWSPDSGGIYKVKLPATLIENGQLTSALTGWRNWTKNNDISMSIAGASSCPGSDTGCLAYTSGSAGASLLISSPFPLESRGAYRVTFSIRAPSGTSYGAHVRRISSPWDTLGLSVSTLSGNGAWQTVSLPFVASETLPGARLDIQVNQPGKLVHVKNVRIAPDLPAPAGTLTMVSEAAASLLPAHHPNRGHNPASPQSPYFLTSAASPVVTAADGRKGSPYLVTGSDLVLPSGATLKPGLRVVLRSEAWTISEHTVTSISGNQVSLDPITPYPLVQSGWGYYLSGARWMLDSPGEWHYDASSQTLYAWPQASDHPADRFSYSSLNVGIDVNRKEHILIEDLAIRHVRDGIYAQRGQNIALRRLDISQVARYGIDGEGTVGLEVSSTQMSQIGSDALYNPASTASIILDNDISSIGVTLGPNGEPLTLPLPTFGAVRTGSTARISGNRLHDLAFIGITAGHGSEISNNAVTRYCVQLNDCSGIYLGGVNGAVVTGNLVNGGVGNRFGIPASHNTSLANGLYLDWGANNVMASDNTFAGGDNAIQLHDASENRVERNTLYGSRAHLIWLHETANDKRATGNIYGNVINENTLFSTQANATLRNAAKVENTADFAVYEKNVYSNLVSSVIAVESSPTSARSYQFADWQTALDDSGIPRNLDINGQVSAPISGFANGTLGTTLVVNGDLADGTLTGWSGYSAVLPTPSLLRESCAPLAAACVKLTAGGSTSLLSSPRFDVRQGQWYRVSFDAQAGTNGQIIKVKSIQAGPTSYAGIMNIEPVTFSGSTQLKRYTFLFKSTATVTRSSSSFGARVDFMEIKPGQYLRVTNFEIVPYTPTSGAISHALLSNAGRETVTAACPTETTAPQQCTNYYAFPQGGKVVWPLTLAPLEAQIVFSQNAILPDSDKDSIADNQDACAATVAGAAVNARGCALGQ